MPDLVDDLVIREQRALRRQVLHEQLGVLVAAVEADLDERRLRQVGRRPPVVRVGPVVDYLKIILSSQAL